MTPAELSLPADEMACRTTELGLPVSRIGHGSCWHAEQHIVHERLPCKGRCIGGAMVAARAGSWGRRPCPCRDCAHAESVSRGLRAERREEADMSQVREWLAELRKGHTASPKIATVLDVIAGQPRLASYASAAEVAERAGVNTATVVRAAQSLGFDGWLSLRAEVRSRYLASLTALEILAERADRSERACAGPATGHRQPHPAGAKPGSDGGRGVRGGHRGRRPDRSRRGRELCGRRRAAGPSVRRDGLPGGHGEPGWRPSRQ